MSQQSWTACNAALRNHERFQVPFSRHAREPRDVDVSVSSSHDDAPTDAAQTVSGPEALGSSVAAQPPGGILSSPFDADIFSVAVPALASIMLDAVMLLVDTAIIGRLGTAPLGAVGLSTLLFMFSNLFFNFLTVVTTSAVANAAAEKDTSEVSKSTARGMFVGLLCGALLIVLLYTYSPLLMQLLGTTPETANLAVMYLRVRCFACPAFLLYNVGTGNFRGRKDTRTPLLAYMANNATYVLLELLFVFGLKWGVVGAALAPAIGQYVGLAVMVGLLIKEKALFAEDLSSIPTLKEVTPLLQKGLPLGAVNLLVLPVVVGCTSLVTALGVTSLAAHTIVKQVWDFWMQVSQSLNISANSMVASALGANDMSTAREVLMRILLMGAIPGVLLGIVFLVAQGAIPAAFTQDEAVIRAVTRVIPLLAVAMPLIPVATVLEGALLGALDTGYIAKRTGLGIVIALATIYASQHVFNMGLLGIWIGLASFFGSNAICDTARLMSSVSPLPVTVLPGQDPPIRDVNE
eukprot:CAMPEP_0206138982 /NCGR_PEP_ID=MMETSP1473-20131121/4236_1 /ASSEMBLY_ACC=CAM_ASM_001109 /TAXON_ID=1461547 /ORGANISM="Stichococcus sp, Strain RCC1054" /LENGTH=520 /DNA_ID=CAMNT_0053532579 /DNA_START=234 /DNA_END=1797 /DNA_ORIENTATION=-